MCVCVGEGVRGWGGGVGYSEMEWKEGRKLLLH